MKCLTITIFNRYFIDSEYYHDSETWIQILSISTCGRETKYSHTSLLEPSNRKISSSLSRSISSEIFLIIFDVFTWLWVCRNKTMSNTHTRNHMSTIMIVVFNYHCCANTDDNDSHILSLISPSPTTN